jgi:hypothetical protein
MPNLFMRKISVVRFILIRAASALKRNRRFIREDRCAFVQSVDLVAVLAAAVLHQRCSSDLESAPVLS